MQNPEISRVESTFRAGRVSSRRRNFELCQAQGLSGHKRLGALPLPAALAGEITDTRALGDIIKRGVQSEVN